MTNIEYYDVILRTLFLRKLGIILDFTSPGVSCIGNELISTDKVAFANNSLSKEDQTQRWTKPSGPWSTLVNSSQEDKSHQDSSPQSPNVCREKHSSNDESGGEENLPTVESDGHIFRYQDPWLIQDWSLLLLWLHTDHPPRPLTLCYHPLRPLTLHHRSLSTLTNPWDLQLHFNSYYSVLVLLHC